MGDLSLSVLGLGFCLASFRGVSCEGLGGGGGRGGRHVHQPRHGASQGLQPLLLCERLSLSVLVFYFVCFGFFVCVFFFYFFLFLGVGGSDLSTVCCARVGGWGEGHGLQ